MRLWSLQEEDIKRFYLLCRFFLLLINQRHHRHFWKENNSSNESESAVATAAVSSIAIIINTIFWKHSKSDNIVVQLIMKDFSTLPANDFINFSRLSFHFWKKNIFHLKVNWHTTAITTTTTTANSGQ